MQWVIATLLFGSVGFVLWLVLSQIRRIVRRRRANDRMLDIVEGSSAVAPYLVASDDRHRDDKDKKVSPWLMHLAFGLLTGLLGAAILRHFKTPWPIAAAFAAVLMTFYRLMVHWYIAVQRNRSEGALADVLDLMVSSLRTGAALPRAIEYSIQSARDPLRSCFAEIVGRMRLGESPDQALDEAVRKIDVESMRLFSITLQAHHRSGGSLAPALARTASSIRDKVEVGRRVTAETSQARVSVLAMFGIVYGVAWIVWRQDPQRVSDFVTSSVGAAVLGVAITMQAAGVLWMQRLTKTEF